LRVAKALQAAMALKAAMAKVPHALQAEEALQATSRPMSVTLRREMMAVPAVAAWRRVLGMWRRQAAEEGIDPVVASRAATAPTRRASR
jgi:hypothetical protein